MQTCAWLVRYYDRGAQAMLFVVVFVVVIAAVYQNVSLKRHLIRSPAPPAAAPLSSTVKSVVMRIGPQRHIYTRQAYMTRSDRQFILLKIS